MNQSLQEMTLKDLQTVQKAAQLAIGRAKMDRRAALKRSATAKIRLYKINLELHRRKSMGVTDDDE